MNKKVIIIGASGHAKVIADIVIKSGDILVGFLDDNSNLPSKICGFDYLGNISKYVDYPNCEFIIGIGNTEIRKKISIKLSNVKWYTAIHPTAVISSIGVNIGAGTCIMPNVVVNSCSTIANHCIINSGAIIEHENFIDDYAHISVGAKLAGNVHVGNSTWIGIGATIINNISICSNCIIGAGATVIRNIEYSGTYVGIPTKKIDK